MVSLASSAVTMLVGARFVLAHQEATRESFWPGSDALSATHATSAPLSLSLVVLISRASRWRRARPRALLGPIANVAGARMLRIVAFAVCDGLSGYCPSLDPMPGQPLGWAVGVALQELAAPWAGGWRWQRAATWRAVRVFYAASVDRKTPCVFFPPFLSGLPVPRVHARPALLPPLFPALASTLFCCCLLSRSLSPSPPCTFSDRAFIPSLFTSPL